MILFVAPEPNCGHRGVTLSWTPIASTWLCPPCVASIGALYRRCARCGSFAAAGTSLVDVLRIGLLCFPCRRDHLAERRIDS